MSNDVETRAVRPEKRRRAGRRRNALLAAAFLTAAPATAHAQLADAFQSLFDYGNCGQPLCLSTDASPGHGDHFVASRVQGASNMLAFIQSSLFASLASLPVSSATSGVTFEFDQAGLPVESAVSPGPVFAERAQTLGAGRLVFGVNVSGINYNEIRGVPLNDVDLVFTHEAGNDVVGDIPFENDLIEIDLDLSVRVLAASATATFGLTDRIDVGIAVPFVRTQLEASTVARVVVFETTGTPRHSFGTAQPTLTANSGITGTASGIGDVAGRVKVNLMRSQEYGVAFLGEVRLPTGKVEDFLGSGETTVRGFAVLSARRDDFSPHANIGLQYTTGDVLAPSGLTTVGFDYRASDFVTVSADFIGRFEVGSSKLVLPPPVETLGLGDVELSNLPNMTDHGMDMAFGFKATPMPGLRAIANALVPLNQGGMRPSLVWTFGFEYSL